LAPQRSAAPAPPPPVAQVVPAAAAHGATAQPAPHLVLYHEGQAFPVSKERYVIGRGKSSSDMTIRDPNISRQHAIVELLQGVYYMVDLGSTNGIEFAGQRVQRKAIHHGDVFQICDHDVICHLA
jgi:pSer/pThr/pTyr-binding forkhead associated (FHA) protein